MSGPIVDQSIRICPHCGALYLEDDHMYEDVNRCPHCGRQVFTEREDAADELPWI